MIQNLIQYLQNLTKRDITPEEFTVYKFPDRYTILQILHSIGDKLANLWDTVKITSHTETVETGQPANVSVTGDADNLNFNFQIPGGEKGDPGPAGQAATITVGKTTMGEPGTEAQVTNSGTAQNAIFDFTIPAASKIYTAVFPTSGWVEMAGGYEQTVDCTGMTADITPQPPTVQTTGSAEADKAALAALACIQAVQTLAGQVRALCYDAKPVTDVTIYLTEVS